MFVRKKKTHHDVYFLITVEMMMRRLKVIYRFPPLPSLPLSSRRSGLLLCPLKTQVLIFLVMFTGVVAVQSHAE